MKAIRVLLLGALLLPWPAWAQAQRLRALDPGEFVTRELVIPVQLVFVGYDAGSIDEAELRSLLPETYAPLVRSPQYYGLSGRDLGVTYRFRYEIVHEDRRFADRFFAFLASHGKRGPITDFQQRYNDQTKNVREVSGPVLYIDAPSTESYLAREHRGNPSGYTLFFVNWYGRRDFKFHVYTKTDQPDPDTGVNAGAEKPSRAMIAWGGSASRTWFYDLSAGPEAWTANWIVDDEQTYHMPPIWEYAQGGYRPPAQLSSDLGLVARFVAIDLLFTTSPIYDPLVTAPGLDGAKVLHSAMLEDDPDSAGADFMRLDRMRGELRKFEPYYEWKVKLGETDPIDADARRALDIFGGNLVEDDCWTPFGFVSAQLFCYFSTHLSRYIPAYGRQDYVAELFAYNTTDAALGSESGLLGFAEDNWKDGTQSHIFAFDTPGYRELGYGFTSTAVHEMGHHIGMSHPHDGYDSELQLDFGSDLAEFEFAWSGDESHTIMHYIDVSTEFGRFDRDNLYRWEAAGYLNWSNAVLGDLVHHPRVLRVWPLIQKADVAAVAAVRALDAWDLLQAATQARNAYLLLATAASRIDAPTPTLSAALRRLPGAAPFRDGCRMREP